MNIIETLRQSIRRRRTLDALSRLDAHLLRDIGFEQQIGARPRHGFARLQDVGR